MTSSDFVTTLAGFLLVIAVVACRDTPFPEPVTEEVLAGGEQIYRLEGCETCHGEAGEGVVGPQLSEGAVLATFPNCEEQIIWVTLGSAVWSRDIGPTYGAGAKPVTGGMPRFGSRLTAEQIQRVVSFTRVEFGGEEPARAVAGCVR